MALVEDVALAGLDEEEDAKRVSCSRGAVGLVGLGEPGGEGGDGWVVGEILGFDSGRG